MSDKWYECPTCCYSTTSERNFLKHGLTHVDAPAPAQPTGEGLTTQVILDRQEKAGCYTDTVSRSTHATENQSTKMTEAAQSTTVVHVPIPEGNESRYVEVLREQSQATQPTSCKDCDGTGRFVDQSEGCSPFSGRSCRSCNGTGKQAEQPVAEPSDNDTINKLRTTLKACRMKFLDYVNIHQERGNVDKAKSNQRMVDLCTRTLQESQATLPPSSSELTWKEAVIEACVVNHLSWDETNPKKTLADLISWEVQVALDSRVSEEARKLRDTYKVASSGLSVEEIRTIALKHLPEMWRYPKGKPVDYNRVYREHAIAAITEALSQQAGHTASPEARLAVAHGTDIWKLGNALADKAPHLEKEIGELCVAATAAMSKELGELEKIVVDLRKQLDVPNAIERKWMDVANKNAQEREDAVEGWAEAESRAEVTEARLGTLRKELGERTMTEATAIDEMREAEVRAEKAEYRVELELKLREEFRGRAEAAEARLGETRGALINALEKLIEITYTAAVEDGDPGVQNARIHGRAVIALARKETA